MKESGGNVAESARAAVKSAAQTATTIGSLAVLAVRQVMAGVSEGMDEIVKARVATARPTARPAARKRAAAGRRAHAA